MAECTFAPNRSGAKVSDQYLSRVGRKKATPEDFHRYEEEKQRRIAMRKQIIAEVESKELTFKPQLGEKSQRLTDKLTYKGVVERDPVTRTTITPATHPSAAGIYHISMYSYVLHIT